MCWCQIGETHDCWRWRNLHPSPGPPPPNCFLWVSPRWKCETYKQIWKVLTVCFPPHTLCCEAASSKFPGVGFTPRDGGAPGDPAASASEPARRRALTWRPAELKRKISAAFCQNLTVFSRSLVAAADLPQQLHKRRPLACNLWPQWVLSCFSPLAPPPPFLLMRCLSLQTQQTDSARAPNSRGKHRRAQRVLAGSAVTNTS